MTRSKKNTPEACKSIAEASVILTKAEIPEAIWDKFNPKFEAMIAKLESLSVAIATAIEKEIAKDAKAEVKAEKLAEKIEAKRAKIAALQAELDEME